MWIFLFLLPSSISNTAVVTLFTWLIAVRTTTVASDSHTYMFFFFFLQSPWALLFPLSFQHKVCVSFSVCWLHASGWCGVNFSWACGTMSLFSLCICSGTHHAAASGCTPADRLRAVAKATSPNLREKPPCTSENSDEAFHAASWTSWDFRS